MLFALFPAFTGVSPIVIIVVKVGEASPLEAVRLISGVVVLATFLALWGSMLAPWAPEHSVVPV